VIDLRTVDQIVGDANGPAVPQTGAEVHVKAAVTPDAVYPLLRTGMDGKMVYRRVPDIISGEESASPQAGAGEGSIRRRANEPWLTEGVGEKDGEDTQRGEDHPISGVGHGESDYTWEFFCMMALPTG